MYTIVFKDRFEKVDSPNEMRNIIWSTDEIAQAFEFDIPVVRKGLFKEGLDADVLSVLEPVESSLSALILQEKLELEAIEDSE